MKRILLIAALALSAAGCAQLQGLKSAYSIVTESTVPAQSVIVAANAFDALQGTATQYLIYCKANLATAICSAANRRNVIKYVRVGRAARNQLETSIASGANGPAPVYNALIAAITQLNASAVGAPR